jgi:protein O-mannosyl-transferase
MIFQEKLNAILCLVLMLGTLAFYNPVVHNGFTNLDDNVYLTENPHVRAGLTWATVKWAFTSRDSANWHPLTWLSHALDCQLFNLNAAGHHYVSVLLHAGNVVLLFALLEIATGLTWPSFLVAALFAFHPINVESVAWAAERKNVLSMFFFLLTLHAYHRYVRKATIGRYLLVAFLFALGLMAKPEIITLPFILLLWDYWPLRRMPQEATIENADTAIVPKSFSYLFAEKLPLLLLSAASAIITLIAQRGGHALHVASPLLRCENALLAYVRYLGKAFWPVHLAALYPYPANLLPKWQIFACVTLLALLTALTVKFRSHGYLSVGWFWFLGTLVPVIGLVQVGAQSMADRYAYLPFIGLFIAVVWGIEEIRRRQQVPVAWVAVPAIAVLAALGALTSRQISYWRNSETLWQHTLSVTQQNYAAHDFLAHAFEQEGRAEEAIAEYNAAGALKPYPPTEMLFIGIYEQAHGHVSDAITQFVRAAISASDQTIRASALACMGSAFVQQGSLKQAGTAYDAALQQDPQNLIALLGSGLLAEREGNSALALTRISNAIKIQPSAVAYLLLAHVDRHANRIPEAEAAETQARLISHNFTQDQQSAAQVLASVGIHDN